MRYGLNKDFMINRVHLNLYQYQSVIRNKIQNLAIVSGFEKYKFIKSQN